MTEKRPQLKLIQGTPLIEDPLYLVHLLEVMDARDALPILRARMRRGKAAANSALALVEPGSPADHRSSSDAQSTSEPV